jgi:hypothetical protein
MGEPIATDQSGGWLSGIMDGVGNLLGAFDAFGAGSVKEAWKSFGGGAFSNMFTPIQSAFNQLTYDPLLSGAGEVVDRGAKLTTDLAWGFLGGPWAGVDFLSGGNMAGGIDATRDAFMGLGAGVAGDTAPLLEYHDRVFDGDYGAFMAGPGVAVDALAQGAYAAFADGDQQFDWDPLERSAQSLTGGAWYNPYTHVANLASGVTGYLTDDTTQTDEDTIAANLRARHAAALSIGDQAGAARYLRLLQQRGG